jgi:histone acetyltransferase 1
MSKGVDPDDILAILEEKIPGKWLSNLDVFTQELEKEASFSPFGEKKVQHVVTKEGITRTFEVYRTEADKNPGFLDYHSNIETWLLWFIDGASYIDVDDGKWEFFTLYEKTTLDGSSVTNGAGVNGYPGRYHFVGYCTVYRYYAYPDKCRPRISQFLILPPFQRQGLGSRLLNCIYDHYKPRNEVTDITVEDPSDTFVRLRDYVDCINCSKLDSFQKEKLIKGWDEEVMGGEAREKLKINIKQARRVYEILKYKNINPNDEEAVTAFRLEVKSRLNAPFLKTMIRKSAKAAEDSLSLQVPKEVRAEELQNLFTEVEEEYKETVEKLLSVE